MRRFDRGVLFVGVERAVKRQDAKTGGNATPLQVRHRPSNLRRARQKTEHGTRAGRQDLDRRLLDGHARPIGDLDGMDAARNIDHRAVSEKRRDPRRIERRRHDDDPQIVPGAPGLSRECQPEVGVDAPLVKLVDDDGAKAGEGRILLKPRGEDAFGGHQQPRVG